jgi:hypothetical protein
MSKAKFPQMFRLEEIRNKFNDNLHKGTFLNYVDKRGWVGGSSNVNVT